MPDAVLIAGIDARSPLISIALQGILYGFSTCMFGMTIWILGFQRGLRGSNAMLCTAFVLWALPTARMVIDIYLTVTAFVSYLSAGPGNTGPEQFLSQFWLPVSVLDNTIYSIQTLIGDAVVIYRCYVVWQSWKIIVAPCVAWVAAFGTMIFVLYSFGTKDVSGQKGLSIYVCTLTANLLATVALAYRIWKVDREAAVLREERSTLRPVLAVVIESGAIYSIVLILALITTIHALSVEYIVNSFIPATISITFNMIFMRIGLSRTVAYSTNGSSTPGAPLSTVLFNHTALETDREVGFIEKEPRRMRSELSSGSSTRERFTVHVQDEVV